jgi:F0F1-type ATP synthase epsilon subunit
LRRAEERLHAQQGTINRARADAALRRSLNRLKVAGKRHRIDSKELSKINDR